MPVVESSRFPPNVIFPEDDQSVGIGVSTSPPASAVFIAANRAVFVPFFLYTPQIVYRMLVPNGLTVSGNIDVGVYSWDGTRLVSSGSTVQTGVSTTQEFTLTATQLDIGLYYMAVAMDNVVGTIFRKNISGNVCRGMGLAQMATAFPLPAVATLVSVTGSYIPQIGVKFFNA